jgi:hypothetical protein
MIIRFGLDFDRKLPDPAQNRIGQVTVGPAGLLAILETRLGLSRPEVSAARRLVQYHACLSRLNHPRRFYAPSFKEDPLAVSRTLLDWRDRWYAAGWTGTFSTEAGPRLHDMAEIETAAAGEIAPCFGQRLQAVLAALAQRTPRIDRIEVVDAFSELPHLWQQVLAQLAHTQLDVDGRQPAASGATDLGRLQRALLNLNLGQGAAPGTIDLEGDGSVLVLAGRSKAVSARLLAEHIRSLGPNARAVVLTGKSGSDFDDALESIDAARCGFQNTHHRRPALQVLTLALNLLWEPLDPAALLQFLTHPVGPLPGRVCRRLARAVSESPGIGGRSWQAAVEEIRSGERARPGAGEEKPDALPAAVEAWLMTPRYEPEAGAPTKEIGARCRQVAAWLSRMMGVSAATSGAALYAQAHRQAVDLGDALEYMQRQGLERLDRNQLNRLMDQVAGTGGPLADRFAEVPHVPASDSPAVFCGEWDEVIWWDFCMPELPRPYPWTQAELAALERHGVRLQSTSDRLKHLAAAWLRPVMSAKNRIVLLRHYSDEAHHPLWDQIKVCSRGWIEVDLEERIQKGERFPGLAARSQPLETKPLPEFKRWWRLGDGHLLGPRKRESFTSLDAFIKSPYLWVLRHKAYLSAGNLAEMPSGNLLKGTLAHRLFEDFFTAHADWRQLKDGEIVAWLDRRMPVLLAQEGALLLQPGKATERDAFEEIARRALLTLIARLKDAGGKEVAVESYHVAPFGSGQLGGYIDLLLTCEDGSEKVLDMKWSYAKYKVEELRDNSQLQLAVYAYLRKETAGVAVWPPQAYFIIDDAQLLSQDAESFPGALACVPAGGETTPDLWRRFEVTRRWRRRQLDAGRVEVTVTGTEPDAGSTPPAEGMAIEEVNDRFNEFGVLTGWGEDA